MKNHLYAILLLSILFGCTEDKVSFQLTKMKYGQSFGFCVGYCTRELQFTDTNIVKILTPSGNTENLPIKTCSIPFDSMDELLDKIDRTLFFEMDEVIGCPDCADGGAEWIELVNEEGTKKVTFPYQDEPNEFRQIIEELRSYHDLIGECD